MKFHLKFKEPEVLQNLALIIIFLSIISFPEINRNITIVSEVSLTENRKLQPYPLFDWRNLTGFARQFDLFYNDHFGFRNQLVAADTFLHIRLFGISNVQHVVIGRDNWLFLNEYEPTDPRAFGGCQGYDPFSSTQLMTIQKNIEEEHMWFANNNITYLILSPPDKCSVYPEYLPRRFQSMIGPSRLAQIFEHMKSRSKFEIIDIRERLKAARKIYGIDTYYKTDAHWNSIGAFIAYEEIMKRLILVHPNFVRYRWEDFILSQQYRRPGDLARMLNVNMSHVREYHIDRKVDIVMKDPNRMQSQLLVFGDSFANYFLTAYFKRHFYHVNYKQSPRSAFQKLDKAMILKHRPDVVIFESTERFMTIIWNRVQPYT